MMSEPKDDTQDLELQGQRIAKRVSDLILDEAAEMPARLLLAIPLAVASNMAVAILQERHISGADQEQLSLILLTVIAEFENKLNQVADRLKKLGLLDDEAIDRTTAMRSALWIMPDDGKVH